MDVLYFDSNAIFNDNIYKAGPLDQTRIKVLVLKLGVRKPSLVVVFN